MKSPDQSRSGTVCCKDLTNCIEANECYGKTIAIDYFHRRYEDPFPSSSSAVAFKDKPGSRNGISRNQRVGGQRTTPSVQLCRGVVADVEAALS